MKHKIWSAIIVIVLILIGYSFAGPKKTVKIETVAVAIGNVREEVSVTGNVKPLSDVDLAFERGGKLASLPIQVGDKVYVGQVLASISNADLLASVNQAKAGLKKALASLGNSGDKATLGLEQAEISLVNTIRDSYTKSDDALRNKVYSLFNDAQRYNAKLSFSIDNSLQEDIEKGRNDMTDKLDIWSRSLNLWDGKSDLRGNYNVAKENLVSLKQLLDNCSLAVNGVSPDSGVITQTQIDTWKSNISSARTSVNTAIDLLTSAWSSYNSASLTLQISKGDTLAEQATVEQAQAEVASAEAELSKTIIRSPINGVVTDLPVKLGEIVSANKTAVTVISYGEYEVEAFVPEADIAKIKINNKASITLDAYGAGVVFAASVIKVDPAATIIDGVPTYKVTIKFDNQDERIRSGMTANLEILTAEKKDVMVVPARAVYTKEGQRFVKVSDVNNIVTEKKVEMGLRGYDGSVEIISGLDLGEMVVTTL